MENYKLSRHLPHDKIINNILALDKDGVGSFIFQNAEDYGLYLLTLLEEVASKKNTAFWYCELAGVCISELCFVVGANSSALYYFNKAHELEPNNTAILNYILNFGEAPDYLLNEEEKKHYGSKLLALDPYNERALTIVKT